MISQIKMLVPKSLETVASTQITREEQQIHGKRFDTIFPENPVIPEILTTIIDNVHIMPEISEILLQRISLQSGTKIIRAMESNCSDFHFVHLLKSLFPQHVFRAYFLNPCL